MTVSRWVRRRPALRNASTSACADGSSRCTRWLCPLPSSAPDASNSALPIGIPPSRSPARASSRAIPSIRPWSTPAMLQAGPAGSGPARGCERDLARFGRAAGLRLVARRQLVDVARDDPALDAPLHLQPPRLLLCLPVAHLPSLYDGRRTVADVR